MAGGPYAAPPPIPMAGGAYAASKVPAPAGASPRPPALPRGASPRPLRPSKTRVPAVPIASNADGAATAAVAMEPGSPSGVSPGLDAALGGCRSSRMELAQQRPHTHCGSMQRPRVDGVGDEEDREDGDSDAEGAACCAQGAAAVREGSCGSCRNCAKLRLRLEHEERARVKAQEQLAKLQSINLELRRRQLEAASPSAAPEATPAVITTVEQGAVPSTGSAAPKTGAATPRGLAEESGDLVSHSLESYRREVAILQEALRERDAREAALAERLRQQRGDHEAAKQEWEGQVAGLVCELQELEVRNRELEGVLRSAALEPSPATTSTAWSARGTTDGSEAASRFLGVEEA